MSVSVSFRHRDSLGDDDEARLHGICGRLEEFCLEPGRDRSWAQWTESLTKTCARTIDLFQNDMRSSQQDLFRRFKGPDHLFRILILLSNVDAANLNASTDEVSIIQEVTVTILELLSYAEYHDGRSRPNHGEVLGKFNISALTDHLHSIVSKYSADNAVCWKENLTHVLDLLLAWAIDIAEFKRDRPAIYADWTFKSESEKSMTFPSLPESTSKCRLSLQNPDIFIVIWDLCFSCHWEAISSKDLDSVRSRAVRILTQAAVSSDSWCAELHQCRLLEKVWACSALRTQSRSDVLQIALHYLLQLLVKYGISNLDTVAQVLEHAKSCTKASELLAEAANHSADPHHITFDLFNCGSQSLEIAEMGSSFPPVEDESSGYTLSMRCRFLEFDDHAHTTLFGAFDARQACFILLYIEKKSRHLIFQSSVSNTKPSVRFKSITFTTAQWYHIAITHRNSHNSANSRASLFINGEFVEQAKIQYPDRPPLRPHSSSHDEIRRIPVQAFFGTPTDLATKNKQKDFTLWCLSSAQLFSTVLSDDLIAVHFELGARYAGNFQDCLGSFQTYEASARLNVRNENLHPSQDSCSDIVSAIRSKARFLLSESSLILNFSAQNIIASSSNLQSSSSMLTYNPSKKLSRALRAASRQNREVIAVNGAISALKNALLQLDRNALVAGHAQLISPSYVDEAFWRLGGCVAPCLMLIESARSPDDALQKVGILFDMIKHSWRNSEAMEKEAGFGILSNMLSQLCQSFSAQAHRSTIQQKNFEIRLLRKILQFLGIGHDDSEEAIINNPLAFRILLIDLPLWRKSDEETQLLYYEQFLILAQRSKHRRFNIKRLQRMRIIKKWLEDISYRDFGMRSFSIFCAACKALLSVSLPPEVLRQVALFVTYSLHGGTSSPSQEPGIRKRPNPAIPAISLKLEGQNAVRSDPSPLQPSDLPIGILEVIGDVLCQENETASLKRFMKTISEKWLLYLLAEPDERVILVCLRIIAQLMDRFREQFMQNFVQDMRGVILLRRRLPVLWKSPRVWYLCLCILLGRTASNKPIINADTLQSLMPSGGSEQSKDIDFAFPKFMNVLIAMLRRSLAECSSEAVIADEKSDRFGNADASDKVSRPEFLNTKYVGQEEQGNAETEAMSPSFLKASGQVSPDEDSCDFIKDLIAFLRRLYTRSSGLRKFAASSNYLQDLLAAFYPSIVHATALSPETELAAGLGGLHFDGEPVHLFHNKEISALHLTIQKRQLKGRTSQRDAQRIKCTFLRRISSYAIARSSADENHQFAAKHTSSSTPLDPTLSNSVIQEFLQLVIDVFKDQVFYQKDFPGLGLFMRSPPGFQEHQAYFETVILRHTLDSFHNFIRKTPQLLHEPRVLSNIARLATHIAEAVSEGWFIGGSHQTIRFLLHILAHLCSTETAKLKVVRLCKYHADTMRLALSRMTLLEFSECFALSQTKELKELLSILLDRETVPLSHDYFNEKLRPHIIFFLFRCCNDRDKQIRHTAMNILRRAFTNDVPSEFDGIGSHSLQATNIIAKFIETVKTSEDDAVELWLRQNDAEYIEDLLEAFSANWTKYADQESHRMSCIFQARITKRKEKLKHWSTEEHAAQEFLRKHEVGRDCWQHNISSSERLRRIRGSMDNQDVNDFYMQKWRKMQRELRRPCGLLRECTNHEIRIDETEGPDRMRLLLVPVEVSNDTDRSTSQPGRALVTSASQRESTRGTRVDGTDEISATTTSDETDRNSGTNLKGQVKEGEFEIVDEPAFEAEDDEDKNRKVMRSLERGDSVEHVCNISRIVGLDAIEGLLIIGKHNLYVIDGLLQRSDGDIVYTSQAPPSERDQYMRIISGRERTSLGDCKHTFEPRHWKWSEILSISRRQFLFRDVAIEIFVSDGCSCLLTTHFKSMCDVIISQLVQKMSLSEGQSSRSSSNDDWRLVDSPNARSRSGSLTARLGNVFGQSHHPVTQKWLNGEISNFRYLMLINTMAGRTFNDLTQYPVFPFVLADYTSDELDLTKPKTFRDLAKPMGCQTRERELEFQARYQSFAGMSDQDVPAFHYGTHYSSAMIVTSYLVRLPPFVQAYLLLQGGVFDHADRMFYSIERTWQSAAKGGMSDVRELIPEFFYLPEFLVNKNKYNLGTRQGGHGPIDAVQLPPWAKGDPKIFIAKHREALESEYVSCHLHQWIDLIFGTKQRGEAALAATNVFHHLSYHGARDLDTIKDPMEQIATIGIIHNFGQTPHQVFTKAHPQRIVFEPDKKRLDYTAETLTELRFPVSRHEDAIASLAWSVKERKVVASAVDQLFVGPDYTHYISWGYFDGSLRVFQSEGDKLVDLFEHIHVAQQSTAVFANSTTLITGDVGGTVSVWTISLKSDGVDFLPRKTLFGHRRPITNLAVSQSFSILLTASNDGTVMMWNLNRLEFVRILAQGEAIGCMSINNVTGHIVVGRGTKLSVWTINGDLIIEQDVTVEGENDITCCDMFEGNGSQYIQRQLIFTGHPCGIINIWNLTIAGDGYCLEHVKRLHHAEQIGSGRPAKITAILLQEHVMFTGDDDGQVHEWNVVQRE